MGGGGQEVRIDGFYSIMQLLSDKVGDKTQDFSPQPSEVSLFHRKRNRLNVEGNRLHTL